MSLFITKISMQTVTETADILFPVYDLLHIQIFYHFYALDSVASWIPRWPHKPKDLGSRSGKLVFYFFLSCLNVFSHNYYYYNGNSLLI